MRDTLDNNPVCIDGNLNITPSVCSELLMSPEDIESGFIQTITLGDGHGNVIQKLYQLVQCGVLQVTDTQYQTLKIIYDRCENLMSQLESDYKLTPAQYHLAKEKAEFDFKTFDNILQQLPVDNNKLIIFIGDLVGDRGCHDGLMMLLLNYLIDQLVEFEALYGNHDALYDEELRALFERYDQAATEEEKQNVIKTTYLGGQIAFSEVTENGDSVVYRQDLSLINLGVAIRHGILSFDQVRTLYNKIISKYKVISYNASTDKSHIHIFCHAPIDFLRMKLIADYYDVPYCDDTIDALCETFNAINVAFSDPANFTKRNNIHPTSLEEPTNPLYLVTWGRPVAATKDNAFLELNQTLSGLIKNKLLYTPTKPFQYKFIHGHVGQEGMCSIANSQDFIVAKNRETFLRQYRYEPSPFYQNTDDSIGRPDISKGFIRYFNSQRMQKPALKPVVLESRVQQVILDSNPARGLSKSFAIDRLQKYKDAHPNNSETEKLQVKLLIEKIKNFNFTDCFNEDFQSFFRNNINKNSRLQDIVGDFFDEVFPGLFTVKHGSNLELMKQANLAIKSIQDYRVKMTRINNIEAIAFSTQSIKEIYQIVTDTKQNKAEKYIALAEKWKKNTEGDQTTNMKIAMAIMLLAGVAACIACPAILGIIGVTVLAKLALTGLAGKLIGLGSGAAGATLLTFAWSSRNKKHHFKSETNQSTAIRELANVNNATDESITTLLAQRLGGVA